MAKAKKKGKARVTKIRLRRESEFNVRWTSYLHPDAITALERMAVKYGKKARTAGPAIYGEGAVRKQLVSFGILNLEKALNFMEAQAGDDIEVMLGI